ncbi:DUF2382 domain-containing protein [Massilia sp. LXY-6]|uniref:DUF2382 domain-containing protein n=1 Tax=Massilia sp. LXY-6 TaxID=3379823 RepID=UPI003EDFA8A6
MQHTLVAVFDNRSDAQNAMDELLASGFTRTDVNVSSADPTGQTNSVTGTTTHTSEVHEGIGAQIKHFFTGLFGSDNDEHVSRYSDVVSRGHHVLTLVTQTEPEVERAADIIERFGPVDLDERHDLTGSASSLDPAMLAAGAAGGSGIQRDASMSSQSEYREPSYGAGSLSGETGQRNSFATQDLNDPVPKGQTYQEPMGGSMRAGDSLQAGGSMDSNIAGNTLDTSTGSTLQGTSSLQGSSDASLGGTIQTGSMQRDMGEQLNDQRSAAIPVVQEDVKIGKREVQRGGVRVFSRVVETPVNETVNLREEHVNVERRPVDQPISSADSSLFKEQTIEMRERAEEAVVQKTARVVEEVRVGKETTQRQENIHDTVRHTEVQVEKLGAQDDDSYFRNDWQTNYSSLGGSYDDYAPAYRYGSEMRRNEKYRNRDWNDIESDLRSDWETRYGKSGASTWDKMKAAVRRGWDKITPDTTDNDSYYRGHYNSNFAGSGGSYDDYAPAYRYGSEMRNSDQYRNRDWNDVESDLRTNWDRKNVGQPSTWEKTKAAVRHGWDKMTPDSDSDDSYYRNHWTSNYGSTGDTYNDYDPAYRYGTQMRSDARYQGRNWDDVESDLRSDWDTRYSKNGVSTWDKMKAAVRHGWDKVAH